MDKAFQTTLTEDSEVSMTMHYERTGKSRLLPAYIRGCLCRVVVKRRLGVHKSRQTK